MSTINLPSTVYLPATGDRPAEPAHWVMTEEDVLRMIQVGGKESDRARYMALYNQRKNGLKATRVLGEVRYLLTDVLRWLENMREDQTR